jgi:DNA-binding response OmpR family regulator
MNVLVIEDSAVDFMLVERALGDGFILRREPSLCDGLKAGREGNFDLVILDLSLPDSRGYATFDTARTALPHVPIVILSGLDDEELALRAVSNGAQDFVRKSRLLDYPLDVTARYAIERKRSEESARRNERRYRSLLENLPTAAFQCDAEGLITFYNRKAVEIWGREPKLNDPSDRFSGAWKLFTIDGAQVSPDRSGMARSLQERRSLNGT